MENGNCKMGKKQKMGNTGKDSLKGKGFKIFPFPVLVYRSAFLILIKSGVKLSHLLVELN